jgi:hypothetical protein
MTQAHVCANWSGVPSLTELWLEALLRMIAMFWVSLAATFQMDLSRRARACDTPPAPQALPRRTRETSEETSAAEPARHCQSTEALVVSRPRSGRPSNYKGELSGRAALATTDCRLTVPLIPAKAGTQGGPRTLCDLAASILSAAHHRSWIPAFAGMSGIAANENAPA